MGDGLDLRGLARLFARRLGRLRVDQVCREERVHKGRLAQAARACPPQRSGAPRFLTSAAVRTQLALSLPKIFTLPTRIKLNSNGRLSVFAVSCSGSESNPTAPVSFDCSVDSHVHIDD